MLQSLLLLRAALGHFDDLVEEYRRVGIIEASLPFGTLRGEALSISGNPNLLVVTSLWPTADAYTAWLASGARRRVTAGLPPLLDPAAEPIIHTIPLGDDVAPDAPLSVSNYVLGRPTRLILVR